MSSVVLGTERHLLRLISVLALVGSVLASQAFPAQFAEFTVRRDRDGVALLGNDQVLLRLRAGMSAPPGVDSVASALRAAALRGARPEDFTVAATRDVGRLSFRGQLLLTVNKSTALAARSTVKGLSDTWLRNLRHFFSVPYVYVDVAQGLLVPVGEQRTIGMGGPAASQVSVSSLAPEIATAKVSTGEGLIVVQALQKGTTVLEIALTGAKPRLVTLEAKHWAARLPDTALALATAPPLPADDLRRLLRNAVLRNVRPMPGATVALGEPTPGVGGFELGVSAAGFDLIPCAKTVKVTVSGTTPPTQSARELLVSNLPERIRGPATLLREQLLGTAPVRLLWHHVNNSPGPLRFVVRVVNRSEDPASLNVTESASGPDRDEIFVGHSAMVRFLRLWRQGEGYVLEVPPGRILELYDVRLQPETIVSGLAHLTPLAGRNLLVEVAAEGTWPTDAYFAPVPATLREDPPLTPYRFEAERTASVVHEVGGAWTFYHVGRDYSENLQGQKLLGDYGVLYRVQAEFQNPSDREARCEIALRASGGVARATFLLDGDLVETGVLQGAREQVIHRMVVAAGQTKRVNLQTMPESGSNYPMTLMLRSWQ